jgi:hypothetical protein
VKVLLTQLLEFVLVKEEFMLLFLTQPESVEMALLTQLLEFALVLEVFMLLFSTEPESVVKLVKVRDF